MTMRPNVPRPGRRSSPSRERAKQGRSTRRSSRHRASRSARNSASTVQQTPVRAWSRTRQRRRPCRRALADAARPGAYGFGAGPRRPYSGVYGGYESRLYGVTTRHLRSRRNRANGGCEVRTSRADRPRTALPSRARTNGARRQNLPPPMQPRYLAAIAVADVGDAARSICRGVMSIWRGVAPMTPAFHAVAGDPAGEVWERSQQFATTAWSTSWPCSPRRRHCGRTSPSITPLTCCICCSVPISAATGRLLPRGLCCTNPCAPLPYWFLQKQRRPGVFAGSATRAPGVRLGNGGASRRVVVDGGAAS
jgi:hypothetical protein